MECKECDRLLDLIAGAVQDGAELHDEIRAGAYADDPKGLEKESKGVDARLLHVTRGARLHEMSCTVALARYAAIPSMTIATLISEFRLVWNYVR